MCKSDVGSEFAPFTQILNRVKSDIISIRGLKRGSNNIFSFQVRVQQQFDMFLQLLILHNSLHSL